MEKELRKEGEMFLLLDEIHYHSEYAYKEYIFYGWTNICKDVCKHF